MGGFLTTPEIKDAKTETTSDDRDEDTGLERESTTDRGRVKKEGSCVIKKRKAGKQKIINTCKEKQQSRLEFTHRRE